MAAYFDAKTFLAARHEARKANAVSLSTLIAAISDQAPAASMTPEQYRAIWHPQTNGAPMGATIRARGTVQD